MTEACTTDQQDSPAPDALVRRLDYILEATGTERMHRKNHLTAHDLRQCRAALSRPETVQAAVDAERSDNERLDYLESGCLDVRWKSGAGTEMCSPSDEVGLIIVSHHMAQPKERIEAENWNHNLRAAIDEAITDGCRDA